MTVGNAELADVSVAQKEMLTYNAVPQSAEVTTNATAVGEQPVAFTYSDEEGGRYTDAVPSFTDAGTYAVYYHVEAANHNATNGQFTVTIQPKPISDSTVRVTLTPSSFECDGTAKTPGVTVGDSDVGKEPDNLILDRDYENIVYTDNVYPNGASQDGTTENDPRVTIRGIGNYTGETTNRFTITAQNTGLKVGDIDVGVGFGDGWSFDFVNQRLELTGEKRDGTPMDEALTLSGIVAIPVVATKNCSVKFSDLTIDLAENFAGVPFDCGGSTVSVSLDGDSVLTASGFYAALRVAEGAGLTISGDGSLTATGGVYAAGIGGNKGEKAGTVTIKGGTVTAVGGTHAAGIGGGWKGDGGDVTISEGTTKVIATGGAFAAGIGGGAKGNGGTVEIASSVKENVTPEGGRDAANIGMGDDGSRNGTLTYDGVAETAAMSANRRSLASASPYLVIIDSVTISSFQKTDAGWEAVFTSAADGFAGNVANLKANGSFSVKASDSFAGLLSDDAYVDFAIKGASVKDGILTVTVLLDGLPDKSCFIRIVAPRGE